MFNSENKLDKSLNKVLSSNLKNFLCVALNVLTCLLSHYFYLFSDKYFIGS